MTIGVTIVGTITTIVGLYVYKVSSLIVHCIYCFFEFELNYL